MPHEIGESCVRIIELRIVCRVADTHGGGFCCVELRFGASRLQSLEYKLSGWV